jgi:hypothetical protein
MTCRPDTVFVIGNGGIQKYSRMSSAPPTSMLMILVPADLGLGQHHSRDRLRHFSGLKLLILINETIKCVIFSPYDTADFFLS